MHRRARKVDVGVIIELEEEANSRTPNIRKPSYVFAGTTKREPDSLGQRSMLRLVYCFVHKLECRIAQIVVNQEKAKIDLRYCPLQKSWHEPKSRDLSVSQLRSEKKKVLIHLLHNFEDLRLE